MANLDRKYHTLIRCDVNDRKYHTLIRCDVNDRKYHKLAMSVSDEGKDDVGK